MWLVLRWPGREGRMGTLPPAGGSETLGRTSQGSWPHACVRPPTATPRESEESQKVKEEAEPSLPLHPQPCQTQVTSSFHPI